jgi:hypothetical protein
VQIGRADARTRTGEPFITSQVRPDLTSTSAYPPVLELPAQTGILEWRDGTRRYSEEWAHVAQMLPALRPASQSDSGAIACGVGPGGELNAERYSSTRPGHELTTPGRRC